MEYHALVLCGDELDERFRTLLQPLGVVPVRVVPLAGDASNRRFVRVWLGDGSRVVACLYPPGSEATAARDATVQAWGLERGLPLPRLLSTAPHGVVSEDLGDELLDAACQGRGREVAEPLLDTLQAFQRTPWHDCPNPPFDAAFFRRELDTFAVHTGVADDRQVPPFLDALAARLERHPYRLLHRDCHVHNLLWHGGRVVAVDFQDMRGGPDTYDAVSLVRERRGSELVAPWLPIPTVAAACGWAPGWEDRVVECGAQRSLKVIGTFLRLAAAGRREYLRFLPEARCAAREALLRLDAPRPLLEAARRPTAVEAL